MSDRASPLAEDWNKTTTSDSVCKPLEVGYQLKYMYSVFSEAAMAKIVRRLYQISEVNTFASMEAATMSDYCDNNLQP